MIDYALRDRLRSWDSHKNLIIDYGGKYPITNENIYSESMEITESICSESELRFGLAEASMFKIRIANIFQPLKGLTLNVSAVVDGNSKNPFVFGSYKVDSDKPTADRVYRDIVAYDALYDVLNADVSDWYVSILPNDDSTTTLKKFRDSFFAYFGITQEKATLANDSMVVRKTIDPSELSGKTVLNAILELNGCFGHIGRNGKFKYIFLSPMWEGLVPSNELTPHDGLVPSIPYGVEDVEKSFLINCQYEDFKTDNISKLQIRQEENDIGYVYGSGNNCYVVEDNFLLYGGSDSELGTIAKNLFAVISIISYRPASITVKSDPCLEIGEGIQLSTRFQVVQTYILQRTIKGIQFLKDEYVADGTQRYEEPLNSTRTSIQQLKGKANILLRTVEETKLTILDLGKGLSTRITQNAESITAEANRASAAEGSLSSRIIVNADAIESEVTRASTAEGNLSSRIIQTASNISAEITRASEAEGELSNRITATADSITAEITRSKNAEETLRTSITANATGLTTKVSKGSIVSEINQSAESVVIKANKIDLNGLVTASQFTSKYATIESLNTTNLAVNGKASIEDLNATNTTVNGKLDTATFNATVADINSLIADKIDAKTVKAQYMEVANWTTSGKIKASVIDTDSLNVKVVNGYGAHWVSLELVTGVNFSKKTVSTITRNFCVTSQS